MRMNSRPRLFTRGALSDNNPRTIFTLDFDAQNFADARGAPVVGHFV